MKREIILAVLVAAAVAVVGYGCDREASPGEPGKGLIHKEKAGAEEVVYTCPMHPQVMMPKPGQCPICGMNLVPGQKAMTGESKTGAMHGSTHQGEMKASEHQMMPGSTH